MHIQSEASLNEVLSSVGLTSAAVLQLKSIESLSTKYYTDAVKKLLVD